MLLKSKIFIGTAALAVAVAASWLVLRKTSGFVSAPKKEPISERAKRPTIKLLSNPGDDEELAKYAIVPDSIYNGIVYIRNGVIESEESTVEVKDLLSVEVISEQEYRKAKKNGVRSVVMDTAHVTRAQGNLHIDCDNGKHLEFTETNGEKDSWDENHFTYLGLVEKLNRYEIFHSGYEWHNVYLVDRNTCIITDTLDNIPFVAPDGRSLIVVNTDAEDMSADFQFFPINTVGEPELKTSVVLSSFISPAETRNATFYTKEGDLYLHSHKSWNPGTGTLKLDEYLKLRFK